MELSLLHHSQLAGLVQYSHMHHFGKIDCFEKSEIADYSAHCHKKSLYSIFFFKLKKTKVICALYNFPGSQRNLYVPHVTFLVFLL